MAVRSEAVVELVLCRKFRTFKLSNDPRFEEKLRDVVGLYLDPPPPLHIHPGHLSVRTVLSRHPQSESTDCCPGSAVGRPSTGGRAIAGLEDRRAAKKGFFPSSMGLSFRTRSQGWLYLSAWPSARRGQHRRHHSFR